MNSRNILLVVAIVAIICLIYYIDSSKPKRIQEQGSGLVAAAISAPAHIIKEKEGDILAPMR